jgi:predicted TIM-barrel fold metal-dependent hydrolase
MRIVDCFVRYSWTSDSDIVDYLSHGWREYFAAHAPSDWHDYLLGFGPVPARPLRGSPIDVVQGYRNPLGDHCGGTDLRGVQAHLDRHGIDRALLCPDSRMILAAGVPTVRVALEAARAINDWTFDRWLTADARLRGFILVPTQAPEAAAEEVRRWGGNDRMAGVLLAAGGLAKPFGHPVYGPIHEAANEVGLPIVLVSGEAASDAAAYPTGGGYPGTYVELRTLAHQSLQSHVASLIALGVMKRFPALQFLVMGGGILWVAPWLWRLDVNYKAFRYDVLWLNGRPPSDVFKRHFVVGTHPFTHRVSHERLLRYLLADPELADVFCYASGYPDWDARSPADLVEALPEEWLSKVFAHNAERVLGLKAKPEQVEA